MPADNTPHGPTRAQVIVITGASSGVGRATAIAFARRGCTIGLLARGEDGLAGTVRDVEAAGGRAMAVPTDVSDPHAVESAAATIEEAFGPIDVWVNNAMTAVFAPTWDMTADEFKRVTEVSYLGYVYGTLAALKRMLPRDRGVIIQVGAALAYRSIPFVSAYCAAKHAVKGFTESLRVELMHRRSRVRTTLVHLPAMNTPAFRTIRNKMPRRVQPIPPIYQPELAAEAILWSVSHARRELFVGWPTIKAVFGNRIAPRTADRWLATSALDHALYDGPNDPDQPDALFSPVPGDQGAHGDFDHRSRDVSWALWADMNRRWLAPAAFATLGLLAASLIPTFRAAGRARQRPLAANLLPRRPLQAGRRAAFARA
ncbi:MAG TPA: SDR family oxidoreductase [Phycisphaerales bacterium]|nr:SDR family oxidoreductase [Phycisphaerales bacterium]